MLPSTIFGLVIILVSTFVLYTYHSSFGTLSKDQDLSSSDNLFSESVSKVPPSALYERDTSITDSNETNVQAETLQNDVPFIENTIKTEMENKKSSFPSLNLTFQNKHNNNTIQNLTSFH